MKIFLPTTFLVIAIAIFFTLVNPLYGDVTKLQGDIDLYNKALTNAKTLQSTQDDLIAKFKDIKQDDKDRLSHFLPNTINNIKFILEIEQIANLHNMQIKNIKFDTSEDTVDSSKQVGDTSTVSSSATNSVPYGTFPVEFTTDSDYANFIVFLKDLEHNLRLVDVKSVGFTVPIPTDKPVAGVDPNIYSYTLKVQTYWLK